MILETISCNEREAAAVATFIKIFQKVYSLFFCHFSKYISKYLIHGYSFYCWLNLHCYKTYLCYVLSCIAYIVRSLTGGFSVTSAAFLLSLLRLSCWQSRLVMWGLLIHNLLMCGSLACLDCIFFHVLLRGSRRIIESNCHSHLCRLCFSLLNDDILKNLYCRM